MINVNLGFNTAAQLSPILPCSNRKCCVIEGTHLYTYIVSDLWWPYCSRLVSLEILARQRDGGIPKNAKGGCFHRLKPAFVGKKWYNGEPSTAGYNVSSSIFGYFKRESFLPQAVGSVEYQDQRAAGWPLVYVQMKRPICWPETELPQLLDSNNNIFLPPHIHTQTASSQHEQWLTHMLHNSKCR